MDQVVARLDEVPDRVICVCAVGARSAQVADYLQAQGREAVNLEGGIQAWLAEGRPVAGCQRARSRARAADAGVN